MLTRVFLFLASMHGICDALTLYKIGWKGFIIYGSTTSFIFWSSQKKPIFLIYSFLTIFPAFFHFLKEDNFLLLFLLPSIIYPRLTLKLYFIGIHSLIPTLNCCIEAIHQSKIGFYSWFAGSLLVSIYFGKECINNPVILDRLLLAVTIPHILLNDLKIWKLT
jgi:hypothetical protein